jgi:DNA polymerase-3 subunit delta
MFLSNLPGDEVVVAVEGLLEASSAGNLVVIVAGALKPTSKLLKIALASKLALALISYPPDARNAPRLVQELAREKGCRSGPSLPGCCRTALPATGP